MWEEVLILNCPQCNYAIETQFRKCHCCMKSVKLLEMKEIINRLKKELKKIKALEDSA